MQPSENDRTYLAHSAALRAEMLNVLRVAAEDVATTDLGGSQEIMRTALPPGREPERHRHPLDGAQGLGLADPDARSAHVSAAHNTPTTRLDDANDNDQDSDADDDSDEEDDADDDDRK